MSPLMLDRTGQPAVSTAIQVYPLLLNLCFELFFLDVLVLFFQVEPYFIFFTRAHSATPAFPTSVSSAECIKTLFTPLLRSLRHRAS